MNRCLSGSALQSLLDGELAAAEAAGARQHVDACQTCHDALTAAQARAERVAACFAVLGEAPAPMDATTELALLRLVPSRWWMAAGVAATVIFAAVLALHPHAAVPAAPAAAIALQRFTPIPGAAPFQMAAVERITLPLRDVDPDPSVPPDVYVQADVIVGEDGAPRAWRLVPAVSAVPETNR